MAKEKTTGFYFKMSPQESEWFERRMAQTGIKNKSAFIRKMCIDGHVINLDLPILSEIGKLLRITSNNAINSLSASMAEDRLIVQMWRRSITNLRKSAPTSGICWHSYPK